MRSGVAFSPTIAGDGSAGDRVDHREDEEGGDEQHGQELAEAPRDVGGHALPHSGSAPPPSCRSSRTAASVRPMVSKDRIVSVSTRPGRTA